MESPRQVTLFLHQSDTVLHATTDAAGRFTYVNDLFRNIFFAGDHTFHDRFFDAIIHPDEITRYKAALDDCLSSPGETFSTDLRCPTTNRKTCWIRWEFTVFPEADTAVVECLGTDISEWKEVQESLSRERQLLRTLIDHLPDAIFVKDMQSRHIINNRALLELVGARSEEETIGRTVLDFFNKESALEQIRSDQRLLHSEQAVSVSEDYVVTKSGGEKWLQTTKVPLREENKHVIGLVGISRDITENKRIEESLRRSIERFNIVSKATNDAIWDWDLIENKIVWNDAVTLLFGYDRAEIDLDNKWWETHIHPDDSFRILDKIHHFIREGIESWQDEYRFRCKNGEYKQVLDRGFILFDDKHQPYRMIGAMMDITERKQLEEELAAHNIARARQVTEATIMAQEKERAEMGRELHDNINQILTTTKMYLDMSLTEKDISEELILKSHENISSAIEEIRILSKALVPPSLGDIGLKEALHEMIDNLRISQSLNIKLRTTGIGKANIPKNVQLMIFRIAQEQMNNILKHAKATEAEIRVVANKDQVLLSMADNGVGFDPRKRMKGIGLMNITSRAEVHDGQVELISSPGNGCTLKVTIPIKN